MFEQFATGLYDKEELRRMMWEKGLKLSKSNFPRTLENLVYAGKVFIPQYKDEDEEAIVHPCRQMVMRKQTSFQIGSITNVDLVMTSREKHVNVKDHKDALSATNRIVIKQQKRLHQSLFTLCAVHGE